jgi:tetratricopeptide (TPR) repeat protein
MNIFGYIIYGFALFITLGWCEKIRIKVKTEQAREKSMELQGFLMTVSLIIIPIFHLSPFHLLWMIPVSFIVGLLSISTPLRILWPFSSLYFSLWYIGVSNLGRQYYVAGEFEKAIEAYKEQLKKKPKSYDDYFNLGLAYGKLGQSENEIIAYKEAIKLNGKRPEYHFNIGLVFHDIRKYDEAINSFKSAIILKSDYFKAHYFLCKSYAGIGDNENAKKELEVVRRLNFEKAEELAESLKIN